MSFVALLYISGFLLVIFFAVSIFYKSYHRKQIFTLIELVLLFFALFFFLTAFLLQDSLLILEKKNGDFSTIGPYGDYIGGMLNPLISLFAVIAAGFAFYAQYKANKQVQDQFEKQENADYKTNFETKFFELIKIHRENVSEQTYSKHINGKISQSLGRKVFRVMSRELEECIKEVFRYRKIYSEDFITPKYFQKLNEIKVSNNLKIDITTFALIDIAYIIFYYGLGSDSQDYLLNNFKGKYDYKYFKRLTKFLQLKPKEENIINFENWKKFYNLPVSQIRTALDEIYKCKGIKNHVYVHNNLDLVDNLSITKYYGGQQHRLGHYYRHLFQTFKFLHHEKKLSKVEKYFYGKTLRAQISTYEQLIFFINSISSLGQKWELNSEINIQSSDKNLLISEYNIIKNLPGDKFLNIVYKEYYPNVKYEFKSN